MIASARVRYTSIADRMSATSTLTATDSIGPLAFGGVALSDQTIAAERDNLEDPIAQAGAYAFAEPAAGWSAGASSAQLTAADGSRLGATAVSAGTVAVADDRITDPGPLTAYVFTEPPGGWSGALHQTATLVASAFESATDENPVVAVSGDTVFVSDGSAVYAFTEPPGGWSGTVPESAILTASDGALIESIAVSGRTLVASTLHAIDVFTQPSGGWSGVIHESAALTPSSGRFGGFAAPVAISGSTIVASGNTVDQADSLAASFIFSRPAGGWSGTQHQAATLTYTYLQGEGGSSAAVGASSGTVALMTVGPSLMQEHVCPCVGMLYTLLAPPGGWSGTRQINPTASVSPIEGPNVSVDGQTVVAGANNGVRVLTGLPALTAITHVSLARLRGAAPRLQFKLAAGPGAPGIKTFTLGAPRGLRFSPSHEQLAKGLSTTGVGTSTVALHGRDLLVKTKHSAVSFTVTVGSGAWTETATLSKELELLAKPNQTASRLRRRALHLTLPLSITNATGQTTVAIIGISLT